MSFHCNARFISKLILDRRIRDGEFIRDRFTDFAAIREANQGREIRESIANEFAIADSAIQDEF